MNIIGILLAGGHSRRFGSNKLLHPLPDGQPLALAAAHQLLAALPDTVAIVRPDNLELARQLEQAGLQVTMCDETQQLMGDSLAAAVRFAASRYQADGFVIALADMPYIQPQTIGAVATAIADGAKIAMPAYQGQRGHPVGFAAEFSMALQQVHGDEGARSIVKAHPSSIVQVDCEDAGILRDIDHPADLES